MAEEFMSRLMKFVWSLMLAVFLLPLAAHGGLFWSKGWASNWRTADWTSAGLLPKPHRMRNATIRIYAARAGRWMGVVAVHSWIVIKRRDAPAFDRYDVVGWGTPVRKNAFVPDGKWFGNRPELVYKLDGPEATALIPKLEAAIRRYRYARHGDYRIWPGPNSNTFVAAVLDAVPELGARLPPTALGRDYPADGRWAGLTPSGTGVKVTLGGVAGLTVGWVEGFEVNLFGFVGGVDIRRPAIKLPGFGRVGVAAANSRSSDWSVVPASTY